MKQFINDLNKGDKVDSLFSVKYKHPIKDYANGLMFVMGVADKTGEIEVTYWGNFDKLNIERIFNGFSENDVIKIKGNVGEYKKKIKIDVNEPEGKIEIVKEYNLDDFIPITDKNIEEMYEELKKYMNSVNNQNLKSLLDQFFDDEVFVKIFKKCPGAMYIHHAYIGGLLEHTLNVVKLCETIFESYPILDHDLLITGAILHDFGKIKEFEVNTNIQISEEGMLRGHIVLGEEMVAEKINKIPGFPNLLKIKILHILLSHHGNLEYGSPKTPQFPEALAIYHADECDSKVIQQIKIKQDVKTDDFHIYTKRFGQIYLK